MSRLRLDKAPLPVLLEGDARVQALRNVTETPRVPEDYVEAIGQLWNKAQTTFLEIGRLLIRAKETLPHGQYTAAVEERLPFSSRTAYQLREAARWTMEREDVIDRLPSSYSTIYLLSTLDSPTYEAAKSDGIVRPELKRAELIAWRKGRVGEQRDRRTLRARREHLLRERARIEEELQRIEGELGS